MNVVSTLVGLSLMGAAAPILVDMTVQPAIAMKKAENFGIAETAAVVFAANYEGTLDTPVNTDTCVVSERENTANAYSVTCTHGIGKYVQSVTRAFRLAVPDQDLNNGDGAGTQRVFEYETPTRFSGHQCPPYDKWGVNGYNDQYYDVLGGACIPDAGWTQTKYLFSHPDEWKYDINNYNGYGNHPDYDDDVDQTIDT